MKWLIPLLAVGICCLFVGGLILVVELNQSNTENENNSNGGLPVLGSVGTPGSPVYASGNIQLFMKVQDSSQIVPGESQDAKHKGWIEVTSYNWTVAAPQSSSGQRTGSMVPANFVVVAETSKATPLLFQDCTSGRQLNAVIAVQSTDSNGNAVDVITWKLSDATINSYNTNVGIDGSGRVYDIYSFTASKYTITVQTVNPDGSLGGMTEAQYSASQPKA